MVPPDIRLCMGGCGQLLHQHGTALQFASKRRANDLEYGSENYREFEAWRRRKRLAGSGTADTLSRGKRYIIVNSTVNKSCVGGPFNSKLKSPKLRALNRGLPCEAVGPTRGRGHLQPRLQHEHLLAVRSFTRGGGQPIFCGPHSPRPGF